jgi:hypothetical protein
MRRAFKGGLLVVVLCQTGIQFLDLHDDGVAGTYRRADTRWTELGKKLVADRVSRGLRKILGD